MSISYPSRPVISIDVPEIKNFDAQFIYNFFTVDEKTNEIGTVPNNIIEKKGFSLSGKSFDLFSKVLPRYIKLSFTPIKIKNEKEETKEFSLDSLKERNRISNNFSKIHSEEEFCNFGFTGLDIQDTGIDGKFFLLMSGTVAKRISDQNAQISNQINKEIENIASYIDNNQVSLLDVSKYLNSQDDIDIPQQFIVNSLNNLKSLGASFYDDKFTKEKISSTFDKLKSVKTRIRINNRIIGDAIRTSYNDTLGLFSDEIGPLVSSCDEIQDNSIQNFDSTTIDSAEYDIIVDSIKEISILKNSQFKSKREIIGYIIEKFNVLDDGSLQKLSPIILENPALSVAFDINVAYGKRYAYQIKSVSEVQFITTDPDTDSLTISTVLISSSPSKRLIIDCVENVPPPSPADFNITWDSKNQGARLMWSFPINKQRDIKKFQVFRRTDILEPFQLIKEYDFDDSNLKTQSFETVNLELTEKLNSASTIFVDKEFEKNSKFIYAVCSIDAHGLTSNYSEQYEVSFDKFKNKINKKLISSSGAPKSYPNFYLNVDTFVDTIKDSNHKNLTIYFNPEYLSIANSNSDNNINLLSTNQNGSSGYLLQIINVDLQKSKKIDIILDDKRSSENIGFSANKIKYTPLKNIGLFKNIKGK